VSRHLLLAYIDPVSGSIIVQALIAGLVGAVAFFRRSIGRVIRKLTGRDPTDE
jgi:hypothetical protein